MRPRDKDAEHLEVRHLDRARSVVVVKPRPFLEQPNKKELRSQRCNRQIEPLDAQTWDTKDDANAGAEKARHQDRKDRVHLREDRHHLVASIGAHAHKCAGAKAQLTGKAGEDVKPHRGQRVDQDRDKQRLEGEFRCSQRKNHPTEQQDNAKQDGVLPNREKRLVRRVTRLELARRAIEHQATSSS